MHCPGGVSRLRDGRNPQLCLDEISPIIFPPPPCLSTSPQIRSSPYLGVHIYIPYSHLLPFQVDKRIHSSPEERRETIRGASDCCPHLTPTRCADQGKTATTHPPIPLPTDNRSPVTKIKSRSGEMECAHISFDAMICRPADLNRDGISVAAFTGKKISTRSSRSPTSS